MRDRIIDFAELVYPLRNHMAITQRSQAVKKRGCVPAHPLPIFVGINGAESVRHGAASAKGNAKIMDRFAAKAVRSFVGLPWNLVHPMDQARVFANWTFGSHRQSSLEHRTCKGNSSALHCFKQLAVREQSEEV